MRAFAERNVVFIDVEKIVLGKDGQPRGGLFREDGVHLTPEGQHRDLAAAFELIRGGTMLQQSRNRCR
jgi:hypothetical protein